MSDKDFLHKLSTPITTLQLSIEQAAQLLMETESFKNKNDIVQALNTALNQFIKINTLITDQRNKYAGK